MTWPGNAETNVLPRVPRQPQDFGQIISRPPLAPLPAQPPRTALVGNCMTSLLCFVLLVIVWLMKGEPPVWRRLPDIGVLAVVSVLMWSPAAVMWALRRPGGRHG